MAKKIRYVKFLDRLLGLNIDGFLISLIYFIILGIISYFFDGTNLINFLIYYFPLHFFYITAFLYFKKATPTMMFYHQHLVSEKTMDRATIFQLIIRYLVAYLSFFTCGLGYLWGLIDKKKRTWHEIASGTIMIYPWPNAPEDLTFARKIVSKAHRIPVSSLKSRDIPVNPIQKL